MGEMGTARQVLQKAPTGLELRGSRMVPRRGVDLPREAGEDGVVAEVDRANEQSNTCVGLE